MEQIIIGTRGDRLSIWQANYVKQLIKEHYPEMNIWMKIIKTRGDQLGEYPLSNLDRRGLFTAELEQQLLNDQIQIAVHNALNIDMFLAPGLMLVGYPKRQSAEETFVSYKWSNLEELPVSPVIATSNILRRIQFHKKYPKARFVGVQGNFNSRIFKLKNQKWDGLITEYVNIERSNIQKVHVIPFDVESFVPSVGQGAIGIEISSYNEEVRELLSPILDPETYTCVTIERKIYQDLYQINDRLIIGANARIEKNILKIVTFVAVPDGKSPIKKKQKGNIEESEKIVQSLIDAFKAENIEKW
ncbi:MAG: hydroxymethylbilane synthase [Candidatus Marinimicrobia bacterium]|nr:hydroxymethylbilane synthase [Candidatus Neomarinimicrobiota bacterium]MDD5582410.1 hydroxymethylbilane synthase [Candidatus Neomarinimicrobiota bacterium]